MLVNYHKLLLLYIELSTSLYACEMRCFRKLVFVTSVKIYMVKFKIFRSSLDETAFDETCLHCNLLYYINIKSD